MKKHLIIAIVIATAALSAVLTQRVLPGGEPLQQAKQHNQTKTRNEKPKKRTPKKGFFSKKRSKAQNLLKPEESKPIEITHLTYDSCHYSETKNGVTVHAKVLTTPQGCLDELGKRGDRLVQKNRNRIFPVKMTIKNSTDQEVSLQDIDAKIASKRQVVDKFYGRTIAHATLLGLAIFAAPAVLFVAGAAIIGLIAVLGAPSILLFPPFGSMFLIGTGAFTAAVVSSTALFIYANKKNSVKKRLQKVSPKELTITPRETKTAMIFVREKDYQPQFVITLNRGGNLEDQLRFNITLPEIQTKAKKKRKKR